MYTLFDYYKHLGLVEVTSKRQKKNGTLIFKDTVASKLDPNLTVYYGFYKSGDFRRIFKNQRNSTWMYKINRTRTVNRWGLIGRDHIKVYRKTDQMFLAIRTINHFRTYLKNQNVIS